MDEIIYDIPYTVQSPAQMLDLYLPADVKGTCPVILWLHPGGFNRGDKAWVEPVAPSLLARGYAVASVNYRLAGEAMFPAQIFDVKAAVRWVRANAGKYRINRGKIAGWGVSAGSTLAALLGTSGGVRELEDLSMGNPGESSLVNAVVSWYGPMDFMTMDAQRQALGLKPMYGSGKTGEAQMFGGDIHSVPEKYRAASPMSYINSLCPPFYIQHGKADDLIPCQQSIDFAAVLRAAIGDDKVTLNLIENAGHFDDIHAAPENIKASVDFLDRHLV